jgi:alkanesulfonate monooxygenase SsuD/methylene tetrahydromethanopterin reductase-like flavin-dependent oxidoreductase (luciferase family)
MKVLVFQQAPYRHLGDGFERRYSSVVTTPYFDVVEPERVRDDYHSMFAEVMTALRAGFDGVAMTEHAQSSYDMTPNPTLPAAVFAYLTHLEALPVAIDVLGRSLGKPRDPLKVAEEYAMLDCISGGRLIAGFPMGLSYDANQNAGIPPVETRERFYENHELVMRAWSAREPFAWNGRFSQYAQVNVWPRPLQQPSPPVWLPGSGSPGTMAWVLEREYVYTFLSWLGAKLTGPPVFDRYWELAEQRGRDRNPYRLAFLQVAAVAETDERAEREHGPHLEYFFRKGLGGISATQMSLPGYTDLRGLEAAMRDPGAAGIFPRLRDITVGELIDSQAVIVGSPATVRDQLSELVRRFRIGNLLLMLQVGSMPRELVEKSANLLAEEVLPHLRTIWADEGWQHRWWPRALSEASPAVSVGEEGHR